MLFDRYASIVFIALGVALFFYSQTLTATSTGTAIGPQELPLFLSVALVLTAGINLVAAFRTKPAQHTGGGLDYRKFVVLLGSLLAYVLLLEPLGYVISTFLFLMAGFQIMEKGRYLTSAVIAGAFSAGIYLLYVKVALGVLPGLPFVE